MIGYTGFSEEEQYYFDLRGYLVVRGVLGDADIEACNTAIDNFSHQFRERSVDTGGLARPERYWPAEIVDGMMDEQRAVMFGPCSASGTDEVFLTVGDGNVCIDRQE